ncbi:MAG TPA: MFS transporter [Lysobacter sp.]|nr:MFS transporter [Lysobacter sp.]
MATAMPAASSWALACLASAMLLSSLGTSIANVALPTFVTAFDTSFNAVQWIVLAYLLAVTTLVVSVGRLGDLFGRRRLMMAGIALFTLASLASGVSSELWMLIASRAAQGFGAAVMTALAMALVGDSVPKARAGRAMGFLGTMSAVGTALGPSLGGGLIASLGWPSIFLVNVPLGLLTLVLAHRFLPPDPPRGSRPSFDVLGSALLALTLAAYALAMTLNRGSFGAINVMLLCVALSGAGLFVVVESRVYAPLVRPALFLERTVGAGFILSGLVTTVAMTTLVVGPFYLSGALGLNPAAVGLVMTMGPLVAALVGVPAGRGVDRYGARCVMIAGLVSMTVGCVALAALPVASGVIGYLLPLVATTGGFAIFQAANNTAVVTGIDASQRGVVSGLLNLSRNLGLITGASAMGAIFAAGTGALDIARADVAAIASGTHTAFAVAALLTGMALVLAIGVAKSASPHPSA